MEVRDSVAKATVWLTKDDDVALHDGYAIEYVITLRDGQPERYQRTTYRDGDVYATESSANVKAVPQHVRQEVERHCIPKGSW